MAPGSASSHCGTIQPVRQGKIQPVSHEMKRMGFGMDLGYPLVNIQKAIDNCHRNSGFTHYNWWFSIAMLNYQRVLQLQAIFSFFFLKKMIHDPSESSAMRSAVSSWRVGCRLRELAPWCDGVNQTWKSCCVSGFSSWTMGRFWWKLMKIDDIFGKL